MVYHPDLQWETFINMIKLKDLYNIEDGWDSYKAKAPKKEMIDLAIDFKEKLIKKNIFKYYCEHVGPTVSGGVGFTFSNETNSIEYVIEFDNTNRLIETIIKNKNNDVYSVESTVIDSEFSNEKLIQKLIKVLSIKK